MTVGTGEPLSVFGGPEVAKPVAALPKALEQNLEISAVDLYGIDGVGRMYPTVSRVQFCFVIAAGAPIASRSYSAVAAHATHKLPIKLRAKARVRVKRPPSAGFKILLPG